MLRLPAVTRLLNTPLLRLFYRRTCRERWFIPSLLPSSSSTRRSAYTYTSRSTAVSADFLTCINEQRCTWATAQTRWHASCTVQQTRGCTLILLTPRLPITAVLPYWRTRTDTGLPAYGTLPVYRAPTRSNTFLRWRRTTLSVTARPVLYLSIPCLPFRDAPVKFGLLRVFDSSVTFFFSL